MSPPMSSLNITIHPVTAPSDVPILASVHDRALEDDPLKDWMRLFTENTERGTTVRALTEAMTDPEYSVVKAAVRTDNGEEVIVGFVHWFCGWIVLEKVDPFAKMEKKVKVNRDGGGVVDVKDVTSSVAEQLADKAESLIVESTPSKADKAVVRARRLKKGEAKYIYTRNHYIAAIHGKKHIFIRRIMVLPEYQGQGIGAELMKVVTDEADRQKIVCWLFARLAGERLYRWCGFVSVGVTEMDEEGEAEDGSGDFFRCPRTLSMIRMPRAIG